MREIPCVFKRRANGLVYDELGPDCEWVLAGEGFATIKRDGVPVLVRDGKLYARHHLKSGAEPPEGGQWLHWDFDPKATHGNGWVEVLPGTKMFRLHEGAWVPLSFTASSLPDGTYEFCGPRINKNAEGLTEYEFFPHGELIHEVSMVPRDFEGLRCWLCKHAMEGIVFWFESGDMTQPLAKLKRADYGLRWPIR